jgi:hypothetical protein
MSEYIKYQHVEKFGSDEVDGIELGTCYVFPKIDGTNAHVWSDGETIRCGSRNRELSLDNDNAGFMAWAVQSGPIVDLCRRLQGHHIFGEWLVPHSLKTYKGDAWRRFYVFDVMNPEGKYVPYDEYKPILDDIGGIDYIHPLRILKNPRIEDIERCLEENTWLVSEGAGEGVVVKNYQFVNRFGRQTWAKMVTSEFKEKHVKTMGAPVCACTAYVEEKIVEDALTRHMIEKTLAKIKNEHGWSSRNIPMLLGLVWHDFITEEIWSILKAHKNPTIDFKRLNKFVQAKIKATLPEIF